ncbi:MAG: TfoX/Sxy family protein [Rubrivivax sp.]|nr:TfoX/Sxy family protein [Rubrivivax sp.]
MAAQDPFVEHCAELLAGSGRVRVRRMFGGHGLYLDGLFVAIVARGRLYLKVDGETRATFQAAGCAPFVYDGGGREVTLNYWSAPDEAMDSPALMGPWARRARQAALSAAQRKPARRRKPLPRA